LDEEKFIELITGKFSVVFYYTKVNRQFDDIEIREDYEWDKEKKVFVYKKGEKTSLEVLHCLALWLIEELIKREHICLQTQLFKLIAWKFSVSKNMPTKIINRLLAVKYVSKIN
jgi:hypothetical protein